MRVVKFLLVLVICICAESITARQFAQQVFREHSDKNAEWKSEFAIEHLNLFDDEFMFIEKALSIDADEKDPAASQPDVKLPWFRTWWAFALYSIFFLSVIAAVIYWRTKNLNEHNKILGEMVEARTRELAVAIEGLKKTQSQLILSEKMASLGQLTAGIAHEINNPLNFIAGGVEALRDLQNALFDGSKKMTADELASTKKQIAELMTLIARGVERSTSIIKSLRTYLSPQDEISAQVSLSLNEAIEKLTPYS